MNILGLVDVPLWLLIPLVLVVWFYMWCRAQHNVLKNLGIPGPEPAPFMGIMKMLSEKGLVQTDTELIEKYGKVVGIYHGHSPGLLIVDPDMIKKIFVKEFSNFTNRLHLVEPSKRTRDSLSYVDDDVWKFQRSVISPTFSWGKMRKMVPVIEQCTDYLLRNIGEQSKDGTAIEMKTLFGGFTMDVVASTAFGVDVDSQRNPNNEFVKCARGIMGTRLGTLGFLVQMIYPPIKKVLRYFDIMPTGNDKYEFLATFISEALKDRQKGEKGTIDTLQLMLNAHKDTADTSDEKDDWQQWEKDFSHYKSRGLSEKEIIGNSVMFLLAGYDTVTGALTFTSYLLAVHPDLQVKVIEEIDRVLGKEKPTYDNVKQLVYLDMFFCEVLRLYPPAPRIFRVAAEETRMNGYTIPKGMSVHVPIYALHRHPDYWPDPEKFDPERFSPENKRQQNPYCYMPFGIGPRQCVGMRLGQLEAKMAIVSILQKYRFVTTPETEVPITVGKSAFVRPANDVLLKLECR